MLLYQAMAALLEEMILSHNLHVLHRSINFVGHLVHIEYSFLMYIAVPVVYQVDRVRDGKSFTTRRVEAIQKGIVVFTLFASFQACS